MPSAQASDSAQRLGASGTPTPEPNADAPRANCGRKLHRVNKLTGQREPMTKTEEENIITDPREDWNLGFMTCFHRRYNLGDRVTDPCGGTITVEEAHRIEATNTCPTAFGVRESCVVLPLHLYDHSGITMNTTGFTCPWDSGRIGIIYAPYSRIRECYGLKRVTSKVIRLTKAALLAEVDEYDSWLRAT